MQDVQYSTISNASFARFKSIIPNWEKFGPQMVLSSDQKFKGHIHLVTSNIDVTLDVREI